MKNKPSVLVLLLLVLSLYILANPGSIHFLQANSEKSSSSSSDHNFVPPLRQNDIPPTLEELSPNLTPPQTITSSIINQPAIITPGTELHLTTRFVVPKPGDYAILEQEINLYLYTEPDLNAKFNGTHLENLESTHIINTTNGGQPVTNATDPGSLDPRLSNDPTEGWINCTITLPTMTDLQNDYNITHNGNVAILQYFPGNSSTDAKIEDIDPFWYMDNFTLTGVANIDSQGITNPQSGDSTFRQWGNASAILNATSEGTGLENVTIFDCELHFSSNDSVIGNGSNGFYSSLHDMSGNRNTTTDTNGNLRLIVNTTTSAKEDDYYFLINASFAGTTKFTQNYEIGNPSSNYDYLTLNFTIEKEMDTVYIVFIDATNQPDLSPPNFNITLVTYRARAVYNYTGGTYYPANIPVNATFAKPSSGGVSLSIANGFSNNGSAFWGLTNSSGYIVFNITAEFPILYQDVNQFIYATADFQSSSLPLYPPTNPSNNQPHRFMRNPDGDVWNVTQSQWISIHPDFQIGEIVNTFENTTSIASGETAYIEFEVRDSNNIANKFYGVPVNFTLDDTIPGVSLEFAPGFSFFNSSHYLTNSTGGIAIYIRTTYLITPEIIEQLDLTAHVDFEHDSQVRWIGDEHVGINSLIEFNQTWLTSQYTDVWLGVHYYTYEIQLRATNESGDTLIRAGDAIELTYRVEEQGGGGSGLAGVPVYFTLIGSNPGVSWNYTTGTSTDGAGYITIWLNTTYGVTPNTHNIRINATADFQNDTNPNVWYVGEKAYDPDFWTNTSYSDVEDIIVVSPQYFIGDIHLYPSPTNPNATSISQTYSINISFRLKLNNTLANINGVPISITINNTVPSTYDITVTPAESQNTSNSIVTFFIETSGTTPQANYYITATAHFGDVKSLTYNVTHPSVPSGKLLGTWVNGSINDVNSTFTYDFRVKNVDVIQVQIADITDNSHPDAGFNATTNKYEVYRGTTYLNISGSYKDEFQTPLTSEVVRISFNYTGGPIVLANPVTDIDGTFWVNVSISSAIPLEDITIYGWDPDLPDPMENRQSTCNIRLMSTINLNDFTLSGYNGTQIFVGETITGSGSLRDDNTNLITTSLTNLIRISGWNGTHDVGTAVLGSYNGISYSLNYDIPLDYVLNDINITLSVIWGAQLQHYRPTSIQQSIFVYRGFNISSFEIYLPYNSSTISVTNNSINTIYQFDHKSVTIQGVLEDLNADILGSKQIQHFWNTTSQTESVLADGSFSILYDFTGYDNTTWEWRFYHILDNTTILSTVYFLTFIWEVYDETAPQFTISSPVKMTTTGILSPNAITRINVTIIDPDNTTGPGYVSVGLDNSSVNITIDGVSYTMTQYSGIYMFYYDWDTSSPSDMLYRINITAKDNAGNSAITINYDVGIDFTVPSATIDVTLVNTYLDVTPNGWAVISGTYNISGQTYANSSLDTSNSNYSIQYNNGTPVFTYTFDNASIVGINYSFNWDIYNSLDHSRFPVYVTSEDWRIVIYIVDMAGNTNQTVRTIKLDNSTPIITPTGVLNRNTYPNVLGRDPTIHSELLINVTFDDVGGTGVDSSTLYFELFDNTTGLPILVDNINSSDPRITVSSNSATLTVNLTNLNDNSNYYIRAVIYDQTSNRGQVLTRTIAIIYPAQSTSTTPTTSTNGGPNGGNPFSGAFLFNLVLLNLLALGGGVGIAVLYERFKTMKG